jgi:sugar phosphate isomerase/epimerase
LWRDRVDEVGTDKAAKIVRDNGLRVSSLCRGGFLTGRDDARSALDDNRRAIDQAATLGTSELVVGAGGMPDRDLIGARKRLAPDTAATWKSRSSTRRCGPPTGTRSSRP